MTDKVKTFNGIQYRLTEDDDFLGRVGFLSCPMPEMCDQLGGCRNMCIPETEIPQ